MSRFWIWQSMDLLDKGVSVRKLIVYLCFDSEVWLLDLVCSPFPGRSVVFFRCLWEFVWFSPFFRDLVLVQKRRLDQVYNSNQWHKKKSSRPIAKTDNLCTVPSLWMWTTLLFSHLLLIPTCSLRQNPDFGQNQDFDQSTSDNWKENSYMECNSICFSHRNGLFGVRRNTNRTVVYSRQN